MAWGCLQRWASSLKTSCFLPSLPFGGTQCGWGGREKSENMISCGSCALICQKPISTSSCIHSLGHLLLHLRLAFLCTWLHTVFWACIGLCKHLLNVVWESRCIEKTWTTNNTLGSRRRMYMQETLSIILQILEIDLREVILLFQSYLIFSWIKENYENLQTTFEKASQYSMLLTGTWFQIASCSLWKFDFSVCSLDTKVWVSNYLSSITSVSHQ